MKTPYKLGIDMGSSSIGWCIAALNSNGDICGIENMGVRIFPDGRDPKTKTPLCVDRRMTRGASRNRDRRLQRKAALVKYLKEFSLMPKDISEAKAIEIKNPYAIRAKGVHEKISKFELGRALFHINIRRGVKSNRKGDASADDSELKGMKGGISRLREILDGRTLGEFLFERCKSKKGARMRSENMQKKNSYEFYADRAMYEEEFDRIWETQRKFDPSLDDKKKQALYEIIFTQRPLKIPERGRCQFERDQPRAYAASEIAQKFRIYQTVSNLEVVDLDSSAGTLTSADRDKLAEKLIFGAASMPKNGICSFDKIRKLLGLPKSARFNFEATENGIKCDTTSQIMASDACFGEKWYKLDNADTDKIIEKILQAQDDEEIISFLKENYALSDTAARNIAEQSLRLPSGTVSLSAKAMDKILPYLREWKLYNEACALAGYDFLAKYKGNLFERLPYYGEILTSSTIGAKAGASAGDNPEERCGKVANPTVHVALNQLRKVVNKIIDVYGKPDEIVLETARDLPLGEKGLAELKKKQNENRKKNEKIAGELAKINVANTRLNREKYKIWEAMNSDPQKRCCPFCGERITLANLFTSQFEIEHLLPFSETFDDSIYNKVISCRLCNRDKKARSAYDAFGHVVEGRNKWADILARAAYLDKRTSWRFGENAMKEFKEKHGDMIARMLCDTRYMSKAAREYLTCILPDNKIYTANGRITALLRRNWGLNAILDDGLLDSSDDTGPKKNRDDNRHHAIDAFTLACTSRKTISDISRCAKICEEAGLERLISDLPLPYKGFNHDVFAEKVGNIIVSFKPDRGGAQKAVLQNKTVGKLHNDTAYGPLKGSLNGDKISVATRVKITSIKFAEKSVDEIGDDKIRRELLEIYKDTVNTAGEKGGESLWKVRLEEYSARHGIRRLRIHRENMELSSLIPMRDKAGKIYKYMANPENYCIDFYLPKGESKWRYYIVNMFAAHKRGYVPQWRKADSQARLVMRLFKQDIIAYDDPVCGRVLARVTGIATGQGKLSLVPLTWSKVEGNPPKKSANTLQELNARKVYVDEIGRLFDPGRAKYAYKNIGK